MSVQMPRSIACNRCLARATAACVLEGAGRSIALGASADAILCCESIHVFTCHGHNSQVKLCSINSRCRRKLKSKLQPAPVPHMRFRGHTRYSCSSSCCGCTLSADVMTQRPANVLHALEMLYDLLHLSCKAAASPGTCFATWLC